MLNTDKELKLYYSISEVAKMFDVNESLLRFWEKEFSATQPQEKGGGISCDKNAKPMQPAMAQGVPYLRARD